MKAGSIKRIVSDMEADRDVAFPLEGPGRRMVEGGKLVLTMLSEYFDDQRKAIDFMRAHAACTIVVPDPAIVETIATEATIVTSMSRNDTEENAARLSRHFDIGRRVVSKAVRDAKVQHCRHPRISRLMIRVAA